jgi:hypothetical protein
MRRAREAETPSWTGRSRIRQARGDRQLINNRPKHHSGIYPNTGFSVIDGRFRSFHFNEEPIKVEDLGFS